MKSVTDHRKALRTYSNSYQQSTGLSPRNPCVLYPSSVDSNCLTGKKGSTHQRMSLSMINSCRCMIPKAVLAMSYLEYRGHSCACFPFCLFAGDVEYIVPSHKSIPIRSS